MRKKWKETGASAGRESKSSDLSPINHWRIKTPGCKAGLSQLLRGAHSRDSKDRGGAVTPWEATQGGWQVVTKCLEF